MFINITFYSKNYSSIKEFLRFFYKKFLFKDLKFSIFKIKFQKPVQKKVFTLLKSPHVNKTAQEQFEYRLFRKQFTIYSYKSFLFFILLKYIKLVLFPDIKIKITILTNNFKFNRKLKNKIHPNNYNSTFLLNYLKMFDFYGEVLLKKTS